MSASLGQLAGLLNSHLISRLSVIPCAQWQNFGDEAVEERVWTSGDRFVHRAPTVSDVDADRGRQPEKISVKSSERQDYEQVCLAVC